MVISPVFSQSNQKTQINFNKLTIDDGLSQSYVYSIIQDHLGYMWIATQDGLNQYDGKTFTIFRHQPENLYSISDSDVREIYEDKANRLWIGSQGKGLNLYNRAKQNFKRITFFDNVNNKKNNNLNYVMKIIEDDQGNLWIATRGGLIKYNHDDEQHTIFRVENKNKSDLIEIKKDESNLDIMILDLIIYDDNNLLVLTKLGIYLFNQSNFTFTEFIKDITLEDTNNYQSIFKDRQNRIWIGTSDGVYQYDINTSTSQRYQTSTDKKIPLNRVTNFYQDQFDNIWIASASHGLFNLNSKTDKMINFISSPDTPTSLSKNNIMDIYQDRSGLFWVGTWSGGINTFNLDNQYFNNFLSIPYKKNTLSASNVWSIIQTKNRHYWFGTDGGGLNQYNPFTDEYRTYKNIKDDSSSISGNKVWAIAERDDDLLWIGTFYSGLNLFDPKSGKVIKRFNDKNLNHPDSVISMLKTHDGTWWFGTKSQGVAKFDAKNNTFVFYNPRSANQQTLNSNRIYSIFEDSQNRIWIGTENAGLNLYQKETDSFFAYTHKNTDPYSLIGNNVLSIAEDDNGVLLVGTDLGLSKMTSLGHFINIDEKDGLNSAVINGVLYGCDKNIWMSTNRGLSKINSRDGLIYNFTRRDGLLNQEFNTSSYSAGFDCELLFGGFEGAVSFVPQPLKDAIKPNLVLTKVLKYFQPFQLDQESNTITDLKLSYIDQAVSFVFGLTDYNNPDKHQYYYRLDSSSKGWIELGNQNQINLTNLPYGSHLLEVKGKISADNWSEIKTLNLYVEPPFWQSKIAYIIYILLVLSLIGLIILRQINKIKTHKANILKEQETSNQLRKLDKLKDQFLANTSHELRTPLNAIIGLSNVIIDQGIDKFPKNELEDLVKLICDSGENLLVLVNDILDYSALNENKLRMNFTSIDIKSIIENLLSEQNLLNKNSKIKLYSKIPNNLPPIKADQQRFNQIILNLVSNALKFTHKGEVCISAKKIGNSINITISDTGIGIPADKLNSIFNRFEQVEGESNRQYGGTGLGLAITKELIELHGGSITVTSELRKGTSFDVYLNIL